VRTLLVATTNPGKLREIRTLMADAPVRLIGLADIAPVVEPEETGTTFQENARLKARYYAAHCGVWTVAEDSGLVIDALGGEPGVRSARFLRPDASYPERFVEILRRLDAHPERGRAPVPMAARWFTKRQASSRAKSRARRRERAVSVTTRSSTTRHTQEPWRK
jgi:non-canonical purine NTP pyrophosphatase (RdgB/HAM1 family)